MVGQRILTPSILVRVQVKQPVFKVAIKATFFVYIRLLNGEKMIGLILNEDKYVTHPYNIFKHIETYIRRLNWRIANIECYSATTDYQFPFEDYDDYFIDGDTFFNLLKVHPEIQWVWATISGFEKNISWEEIKKNPPIDISTELTFWENGLHHLEPLSVFELIAFDSTETYVMIDDNNIAEKLIRNSPKAESLEKYVRK